MRLMTWTAIWIFFLDQVIKFHVLFNVFGLQWDAVRNPGGPLPFPPPVDVFDPYLRLTMAWNRGVNFGLFADFDMRWVLIGVALAISVAVIWWLRRTGGSKWTYLAGGLLLGGALGNVIDRLLYGAVADFLNMSCCGFTNPYAFNVADISIFLGAVGLAFLSDDGKKPA
mgnify:CR=1 FL=1